MIVVLITKKIYMYIYIYLYNYLDLPPSIPLTVAEVTKSTVTLTAKRISNPAERVTQYHIQNVETNEIITFTQSFQAIFPQIKAKFINLKPGTTYSFRIRVTNPSGGQWSKSPISVTTLSGKLKYSNLSS